ncbi:MAG: hypothetical protein Q8P01_01825 [bacterium]|nr:hypothetical protein [bacterium]
MKKSEFGDIIEVVILLAILIGGFFYTIHGLFDKDSISGSHNRYYEAREDY